MGSSVGRFAIRHGVSITFLVIAVAFAGAYAAINMPSAVFPQTDFPRVIIMVQNGAMPADEMMATLTRPIEEEMKELPGCTTIRSSTGRGTAEIDLFFSWQTEMHTAELNTQARLSQIRQSLPPTASTDVYRMNFSTFPIIGLSLIGPTSDDTQTWELARYVLKPKLLRISGVSRVDLVGGHAPEFIVTVDLQRLASLRLDLPSVTDALRKNNLVTAVGMHQEDHSLYLTVVDGRVHSIPDIENLTIPDGAHPVPLKDVAVVSRARNRAPVS